MGCSPSRETDPGPWSPAISMHPSSSLSDSASFGEENPIIRRQKRREERKRLGENSTTCTDGHSSSRESEVSCVWRRKDRQNRGSHSKLDEQDWAGNLQVSGQIFQDGTENNGLPMLALTDTWKDTTRDRRKEEFFENLFSYLNAKQAFDDSFNAILNKDPEATQSLIDRASFNHTKDFPQETMDGKEPQSYPELLEVATAIVGPFKQLLERICRASGFKPSERCVSNPKMTRLQIAPLKGQERADEKVRDDYDGCYAKLTDIVRASILCKDVHQLQLTLDNLTKDELKHKNPLVMVRLKNRFAPEYELFTGYRDLLSLVRIEHGYKGKTLRHVCEVQLHLEEILTQKDQSHVVYEYFRTYFRGDTSSMVDRLTLLYDVAKTAKCSTRYNSNAGSHVSDYSAGSLHELVDLAHSWREKQDFEKLQGLVVLLNKMAVLDDAEKIARLQQSLAEEMFGVDDPKYVLSLTNLGKVLKTQHKLPEAGDVLYKVLLANERQFGMEHPRTLDSLTDYARLLRDQKNLLDAEPLFVRAAAGKKRKHGNQHRSTLTAQKDLGEILRLQGKYAEAEKLLRVAASGLEKTVGAQHEETQHAYHTLAFVLKAQGKKIDSEEMYRQCMKKKEQLLGMDHTDTLASVNNLCILLQGEKCYDEAMELSKRSFEGQMRRLGPDHPSTLSAMNTYGSCLHREGCLEDAEKLFTQALKGTTQQLGEFHEGTIASGYNLAKALLKSEDFGKLEKAAELVRKYLSYKSTTPGQQTHEVADAMTMLANVLKRLDPRGNIVEAGKWMERACRVYENLPMSYRKEHTRTIIALADNFRLQASQGGKEKLAQAVALLRPLCASTEKHVEEAQAHQLLAIIQMEQCKYTDSAQQIYMEARKNLMIAKEVFARSKKTEVVKSNVKTIRELVKQLDDFEQVHDSHRLSRISNFSRAQSPRSLELPTPCRNRMNSRFSGIPPYRSLRNPENLLLRVNPSDYSDNMGMSERSTPGSTEKTRGSPSSTRHRTDADSGQGFGQDEKPPPLTSHSAAETLSWLA